MVDAQVVQFILSVPRGGEVACWDVPTWSLLTQAAAQLGRDDITFKIKS